MTERDQAPVVSEEDRWLASKWFGKGSEPLLADLIAGVRRSGYERGKADKRASVVRWLMDFDCPHCPDSYCDHAMSASSGIEAGADEEKQP